MAEVIRKMEGGMARLISDTHNITHILLGCAPSEARFWSFHEMLLLNLASGKVWAQEVFYVSE